MGIVGRSNDQLHKDLDTAEGNVGVLQTDVGTLQTTIMSAVYTPTLTPLSNSSSTVLEYASYSRIGNSVTVNVKGTFVSNAAGASNIKYSLPPGLAAISTVNSCGMGRAFTNAPVITSLVATAKLLTVVEGTISIFALDNSIQDFTLQIEYSLA